MIFSQVDCLEFRKYVFHLVGRVICLFGVEVGKELTLDGIASEIQRTQFGQSREDSQRVGLQPIHMQGQVCQVGKVTLI